MAPEVIRAELIERFIDVLLEVLDRLQIRMNRRCSIVAADQFLPHSLSVVTEISFLCDNAIPQTTGMLRSTEASPHGAQLATAATSRLDRHRGGGHPPTPATPPCVRVRTRRFESVTLTVLEQ
jgi:hypothetical protein